MSDVVTSERLALPPALDVMMCVGPRDVHGLLGVTLKLLFENFGQLGRLHVVTPTVQAVRRLLDSIPHQRAHEARVVADDDVCPEASRLDPWFRQQYVKLHADRVSDERFVVCLGADALILQPVQVRDFFTAEGRPILRWFPHRMPDRHLRFERGRVRNVAELLDVAPRRSLAAGDFICDMFLFDRDSLRALRAHLAGRLPLLEVLAGIGPRCGADNRFGEWTLYAVYCLDVAGGAAVGLVRSPGDFFGQVHGRLDMLRPGRYRPRVLHFATEPGGTAAVLADLARHRRLPALTLSTPSR